MAQFEEEKIFPESVAGSLPSELGLSGLATEVIQSERIEISSTEPSPVESSMISEAMVSEYPV